MTTPALRAVADLQTQVHVLLGALVRHHVAVVTDPYGGADQITPALLAALHDEARALWLDTARDPHCGDHEALRALGAGEP